MQEMSKNATGFTTELKTEKIVDIDEPGMSALIAKRLKEDIDKYCQQTYNDGYRSHLGGSIIGNSCARYCWLTFRWCNNKIYSGRLLRLFNRGHKEEERFCEWLGGIGCKVFDVAEDGNQHRIKGVAGHFGGSLDGICNLPENYQINEPLLTEFKTSGTGKKFKDMKANGVKLEKPQHYAQMCVYGRRYNFKHALYMMINKNDDDLHLEIITLDWNFALELEQKASEIIASREAPPRLAESPAFFECKYCDFVGICHNQELPAMNCRSCAKSYPIEEAEWFCEQFQSIIPKYFLKNGCDNYKAIINV